jgi:hypothetical protein
LLFNMISLRTSFLFRGILSLANSISTVLYCQAILSVILKLTNLTHFSATWHNKELGT